MDLDKWDDPLQIYCPRFITGANQDYFRNVFTWQDKENVPYRTSPGKYYSNKPVYRYFCASYLLLGG